MSDLGDFGRTAWRDWSTDGVPSSGAHQPVKSEIRTFVTEVERRLAFVRKTGSFAVVAGDQFDVDTRLAVATATLPATCAEGDRFAFNDYAGTWGTYAFTIDPNGNQFEDAGDGSNPAQSMTCDQPAQFELVYAGGKLRVR